MQHINEQFLKWYMESLENQGVEEVFMNPMVESARNWNRDLRNSEKGVSDEDFLGLGVHRILRNNESGRDFFQYAQEKHDLKIGSTAFFDLFQSSRRLEILKSTAAGVYRDSCNRLEVDLLENFPQLGGIEVIAGDGHLLSCASHGKRDTKGRKVAPKSLFMLNVRNGLMFPLAAVQGDGRYAHELPVYRRYLPGFLEEARQGEQKLKDVIMLLDPAFWDSVFWSDMKLAQGKGGRVIIPEKAGIDVFLYKELDFDRTDPVNTGVVALELVGFNDPESSTMHRVVYLDPETGKTYRFLTTAMDLAPGLVALLYLLRWRIEKVFDVFKNKLHESKAWGNGNTCQQIQAQFACMAYNLILLLVDTLKNGFGIEPVKLYKKREKALSNRQEKAQKKGRFINPLLKLIRIPSQFSCQLIRAIRNGISLGKRLKEHIPNFRSAMESYL